MPKIKKKKFNLRKREATLVSGKDGFQLLCNEVKKHPVLYNPFEEGHSDQKRKKNAWLHVSKELLQYTRSHSILAIKRSWSTGVAIFEQKLKANPPKPWKYMEDMNFLLPFINVKMNRKDMTRTDDENIIARLIHEVQKNPNIYDPDHFGYSSYKSRRLVWNSIGDTLGCTAQKAKTLWKRTLSQFREGINQQVEDVGSSKPPIQEWEYYHMMEFMTKFVTNKDEVTDRNVQKSQTELLIIEVKKHRVLYDPKYFQCIAEKRIAWNTIGEKLEYPGTDLKYIWNKTVKRFRKALQDNTTEDFIYYERMKFLIPFLSEESTFRHSDITSNRAEDVKSSVVLDEDENLVKDPIYHFFLSVYQSTDKMPTALQLRMKKKIFEAVADAEELLWEASLLRAPTRT